MKRMRGRINEHMRFRSREFAFGESNSTWIEEVKAFTLWDTLCSGDIQAVTICRHKTTPYLTPELRPLYKYIILTEGRRIQSPFPVRAVDETSTSVSLFCLLIPGTNPGRVHAQENAIHSQHLCNDRRCYTKDFFSDKRTKIKTVLKDSGFLSFHAIYKPVQTLMQGTEPAWALAKQHFHLAST
ncbi:uncharacterized protein MCYG_04256 [Microsporum canis CBS 113480]|uniref:Uncharacterized protein n=1 Tax=Arthroderma otae (strain ATCC MYA-4605 / CBS 113480) TaxID=554155 RepID=C5FPC1_ARTOC|nr:uncharacterized protein MCYG_04256 [Microsporum canis CBS 113480]EEQ31437.1 predicted protein [Microsporum canis CBS 113480]